MILRARGRRIGAIREDFATHAGGRGERAPESDPRRAVATVLFFVFMLVLVTRVLDRAFFESPEGGGVFTGVDHNLGDLPFHLSIATSFLYGRNFPPEHPELAGARLTYPFLVDFVAAMLMAAGATRAARLPAREPRAGLGARGPAAPVRAAPDPGSPGRPAGPVCS